MNSFVNQPLDKQMNRENLIDQIEDLQDAVGPQPSATIGNLSELSPDSGDQVAGTYYVVDQATGAIRGYFTATPNEQFPGYHLAFFNNAGALQFGVSADNGSAVAGAGAVTLDEDGITLNDAGDSIAFYDATYDTYGFLSQTMPGTAVTNLNLTTVRVSSTSNLLTNGGFETGDFTGWTETDPSGRISIGEGYNGGYAALFSSAGTLDTLSQSVSCTYGYLLRMRAKVPPAVASPELYVNGTRIKQIVTNGEWRTVYAFIPGASTDFAFTLFGIAGVTAYIDDMVVLPVDGSGIYPYYSSLDLGTGGSTLQTYSFYLKNHSGQKALSVETNVTGPYVAINPDAAGIPFRVIGAGNENLFYCNTLANVIGVGSTGSSDYKFSINGSVNLAAGNNFYVDGTAVGGSGDGWVSPSTVTPTRVSTGTDDPTYEINFLNTNLIGVLGAGDRVKWTQNSIVRYGIVTAATTDTNLTILTRLDSTSVDYDLLPTTDYAISSFNVSHVKNPVGFPASPIAWMGQFRDVTDQFQTNPEQNIWYNPGSLSISLPIGVWEVECHFPMYADETSGGTAVAFGSLSTSTGSESDTDFTQYVVVRATGTTRVSAYAPLVLRKYLALAVKTVYYPICKTNQAGSETLGFNNSGAIMYITWKCAYL